MRVLHKPIARGEKRGGELRPEELPFGRATQQEPLGRKVHGPADPCRGAELVEDGDRHERGA
ncbi:hypothetical protein [Geobacter sp.]|uniref:hypothetical protein n=1 Tax=Geobacter sp. TaxID=46610 RepID=UPI00262CF60B|nr:hypothetical protein [Geobacter sp.]